MNALEQFVQMSMAQVLMIGVGVGRPVLVYHV
jgi:hypothetical protein